jgi:hypothetical protein
LTSDLSYGIPRIKNEVKEDLVDAAGRVLDFEGLLGQ